MIEVTIDSIRVSLMSQHRIVVLKEENGNRFLPIWIGPFEADAITLQLQGVDAPRPLTHDLLKTVIESLGPATPLRSPSASTRRSTSPTR